MTIMTATLPPILCVGAQKGGVGKSSVAANIAIAIAARGRRVLAVDGDQQGDLTSNNLGVPRDQQDNGQGLGAALQFGAKLEPYRGIRPNLDVVMGGAALALLVSSSQLAAEAGIDLADNLRAALEELCSRESYDLIIIDSGHSNVTLVLALLQVCSHLIIPTREDEASIDGVRRMAASYRMAKKRGSQISLLGVVLFDVNPRATTRNKEVDEQIADMLDGSGIEPFSVAIRHAAGPARAERQRHLSAEELVNAANQDKSKRIAALKEGRTSDAARLRPSDPIGLANDYQELTRQVLIRLSKSLAASAS